MITIKLQCDIDRLPLFRSSRLQFWPILAILNVDYNKSPFLVGIYCGLNKPKSVFEFLGPFIEDLSDILKNGFIYNGQQMMATVCSFVCDAPTQAFIKNIKGHNGYSGCGKCVQVGEWNNKMTFPEVDAKLRTDADFNSMIDDEHHLNQKLSPLAGIINTVTMFPLDYMHLCCLGVTGKLLYMWIRGKTLATRLPSRVIEEISVKLR